MLIEVDTHCHSVASTHAYSTVRELAQSAKETGLKGFALTDHAPASPDSPHIWHFHNLKSLPDEILGVKLLKGVEANIIDTEGNLDMDSKELEKLDWVIASFHAPVVPNGTYEEFTQAYINIAKNNRLVDVIGHCTTDYFKFDYEKVIKYWKEYEKLVEINESSIIFKKGSRENTYTLLKLCKKYEVPIVVNTDCHYCELIGRVPEAEKIIEEVGFPKDLIINRKIENVLDYIKRKRG